MVFSKATRSNTSVVLTTQNPRFVSEISRTWAHWSRGWRRWWSQPHCTPVTTLSSWTAWNHNLIIKSLTIELMHNTISSQYQPPVKSKMNKQLLQFSPCPRSACKSSQNGTPWESRKLAKEREVTRFQSRFYVAKFYQRMRKHLVQQLVGVSPLRGQHHALIRQDSCIPKSFRMLTWQYIASLTYVWISQVRHETFWIFHSVCLPRQVPAWPMASMAYSTFKHSFWKKQFAKRSSVF